MAGFKCGCRIPNRRCPPTRSTNENARRKGEVVRRFHLSVLAITLAPSLASAQGIVNFDSLVTTGPGQGGKLAVYSNFAAQGVTFNGPVAIDYSKGLPIPGLAHSGTIGIEQCYGKEFCTTPIEMRFTTGQAMVKFWAGTSLPIDTYRIVLARAYDANDNLVAARQTAFGQSKTPGPIRNLVQFSMPSPIIRRVSVSYQPTKLYTNGLAIDDVEFSAVGPPPPCPASAIPVVTLYRPGAGHTAQQNRFELDGLIDPRGAALTAASVRATSPSGSTQTLNLLGGLIKTAGGRFGPTLIYNLLFPGTNAIVVSVTNCRGTATASRSLTYAPIATTARFQLQHLEVTQATQTMLGSVVLIARKPTVVRAYLRVTGQSTPIALVGGILTARREDGAALPGPASIASMNAIGVDTSDAIEPKRLDLDRSLNFQVPVEWLSAGRIHFEIAALNIGGEQSTVPCDGCDNRSADGFPAFVSLTRTRRLSVVLAPYTYAPPGMPVKTPDLTWTPNGALEWVNNVYPLPGHYPYNDEGINLIAILPVATTTRDLDDADERSEFLDHLKSRRFLMMYANPNLPDDLHLLGIVPCDCGGRGQRPGHTAFAQTHAAEDGEPLSFMRYAKTWAHELAHNLGRKHAGADPDEKDVDENFPYENGGLGEPGLAVITEWWNGSPFVIDPADRIDFMGYGPRRWVSPYTYEALYRRLKPAVRLTQATLEEKVAVSGRIDPNLAVSLSPGHRLRAAAEGGHAGEFAVQLLDASGNVLHTHRFDPAIEDDPSESRSFVELVAWRTGTRRIVVERQGVVLATRSVSATTPSVSILSAGVGDVGGGDLFVSWSGSDADHDALSYSVFVNPGTGVWVPVAANVTETMLALNTSTLPATSQAQVRVLVSDGVHSSEAVSAAFTIPAKAGGR